MRICTLRMRTLLLIKTKYVFRLLKEILFVYHILNEERGDFPCFICKSKLFTF